MSKKPMNVNIVPDLPDSTKEAALNPAANLIGQAFKGIGHKFLDPLVRYNIVKDQEMEDFANKVRTKTNNIPLEYRNSDKLGLSLKAIEDATYQLNSEELREMFASLIASSVDSRVNQDIHPSFSSILKDLSPEDAKIFKQIYIERAVPTISIRLQKKETGEGTDVEDNFMLFENETLRAPKVLNILERLGLIHISSDRILLGTEYTIRYEKFQEHRLYKHYLEQSKNKPANLGELILDEVYLKKEHLILTDIGKSFGDLTIGLEIGN